jgi:hypothetical protein
MALWHCRIRAVAQTDHSVASRVSEEEKRAALAAVLASESFARSEQLRAFLAFVCEMEIAGRAAELTEYLIGVKALGRPSDYTPAPPVALADSGHFASKRLLEQQPPS